MTLHFQPMSARQLAPETPPMPTPQEQAQAAVNTIRSCFEQLAYLSTAEKAYLWWPVENGLGTGGSVGAVCIFESIRAWAEKERDRQRNILGKPKPEPLDYPKTYKILEV